MKRKKKQLNRNNILCHCGHAWAEHGWAKFPYVAMNWNECYGTNPAYPKISGKGIQCSCNEYKQDNLDYLRKKYESK